MALNKEQYKFLAEMVDVERVRTHTRLNEVNALQSQANYETFLALTGRITKLDAIEAELLEYI